MSIRKLLTFLTACAFAVSVFTACGSQSETIDTTGETSIKEKNESGEDIVLTLAILGSSEIQDVIDEFNAADNGYRIEIKQYREITGSDGLPITYTDEEMQYADMELLQDMINTDEIDIVCNSSFFNNIYYEVLKNKGAFADLYPFMAEDAEVNTDTLNRNVLRLNEIDGKLCTLPTFYGITTMIGNREYVGSRENWTVDEFISHWEKMPDNATIQGS